MTEHMDPVRDTLTIENTPIDSLDFASPVVGLGSKMGLDATEKWDVELAGRDLAQDVDAGAQESIEALKQKCPQIIDLYLPDTAKSSSFAIVSMKKEKAGESQLVAEAVLTYLRSFTKERFVILCDEDVNAQDWNDVIWAVTTRMDPARDTQQLVDKEKGISSLILDATNKFEGEVEREWGKPIAKDPKLVAHIDDIWNELGIL